MFFSPLRWLLQQATQKERKKYWTIVCRLERQKEKWPKCQLNSCVPPQQVKPITSIRSQLLLHFHVLFYLCAKLQNSSDSFLTALASPSNRKPRLRSVKRKKSIVNRIRNRYADLTIKVHYWNAFEWKLSHFGLFFLNSSTQHQTLNRIVRQEIVNWYFFSRKQLFFVFGLR